MPKTFEYGVPDDENPEWTKEDFQQARRLKDLPELQGLYEQLQTEKRQESKPARVIALKLPVDVADDFASIFVATSPEQTWSLGLGCGSKSSDRMQSQIVMADMLTLMKLITPRMALWEER